MPHYVTMSRASKQGRQNELFSVQQLFVDHQKHQSKLQKGGIKYSSQPFLNSTLMGANILDYSLPGAPTSQRSSGSMKRTSNKGPPPIASKSQLDRLNYKTSAVITKPRYVQPVSEQTTRIANDEYLFPDLPPPPDALLDGPSNSSTTTTSVNNNKSDLARQSSTLSSSLDDLHQWVSSATDITMAAQQQYSNRGASYEFNTLPSKPGFNNFNTPHGNPVNPANNNPNVPKAVKVDLSSADKTIRRPGSAPDLSEDTSGAGSPDPPIIHQRRLGGLKHRSLDRQVSFDSTRRQQQHSPGGRRRKVMFTGVSDDEDDDVASGEEADSNDTLEEEEEKHRRPKQILRRQRKKKIDIPPPPQPTNVSTKKEDDIWVLRKDQAKSPAELEAERRKKELDAIPVTGVVIAQPKPCPGGQFLMTRAETHVNSFASPSSSTSTLPPVLPIKTKSVLAPTPTSNMPTMAFVPPMAMKPSPQRPNLGPNKVLMAPTATPSVRPPPPPPPPRTTPQLHPRAPNPALQRPGLGQPGVNESPDEGYHEDDGSELL